MALPASIAYGQVRWHAISGVADSNDPDALPDAENVTGTVVFTPSSRTLLATAGADPVTVFVKDVTARIEDGHLVDAQGRELVSLISPDSDATPADGPADWHWTCSYRLNGGLVRGSFAFELPAGEIVDLTTVAPVTTTPGGVVITKGDKGDPGAPGVPTTTGYFTAPVTSGDATTVNVVSNWGIDSTGTPYYDPAGADPDEAVVLTTDSNGVLLLVRPGLPERQVRNGVSGAVVVDLSLGRSCILNLTGNITSLSFTNAGYGRDIELHFVQDATGGRTLSGVSSDINLAADGLVLSTPGGWRDILQFRQIGSTFWETSRSLYLR